MCNNAKFNNIKQFTVQIGENQVNINLNDIKYVKYKNEENIVLVFKKDALLLQISFFNFLSLIQSNTIKQINNQTAVNTVYVSEIVNNKVFLQDEVFELDEAFKNNIIN